MGEKSRVIRQWVSMPGGSCDLRVGHGAIEALGSVVKGSVGKPRTCVLFVDEGIDADLAERIRRQLTDAGFLVSRAELSGVARLRTLEGVEAFSGQLEAAGVTADDLVCAAGGLDLLSLASFACSLWCSGTPLVHIPCDLRSCIDAPTLPLGIDVGEKERMLVSKAGAKYAICDLEVIDLRQDRPDALAARALMATSALVESEAAVQRLWDRAELLVAGDEVVLAEQLADTAKSRGHTVSSTSIAMRQAATFGQTFADATCRLLGDAGLWGRLLAEGVRFQARIAAAQQQLTVDDVLMMDELLDLLDLEPVSCSLEAEALAVALRKERFERSSRFMLALPRGIGRVRPASVEDEVLREHAAAWCASRAAL